MKEHDYNVIREEIAQQIADSGNSLVEWIGVENTIMAVLNIYMSNDITTGFGQDYYVRNDEIDSENPIKVSVISSPTRISIIIDDLSSYYRENEGVCVYNDLEDDIHEILMLIDAVIARIESRID